MDILFAEFTLISLCSLSYGQFDSPQVYCDPKANEFYMSQGDFCKKCDRCSPGFGLEPLRKATLQIDRIHGATSCQRCIPCSYGYFSKELSYKECQPCKNCSADGKVELKQCLDTRNSECGGNLPIQIMNLASSSGDNEATFDGTYVKRINIDFVVVVCCIVAVMAPFVLVVGYMVIRRKNKTKTVVLRDAEQPLTQETRIQEHRMEPINKNNDENEMSDYKDLEEDSSPYVSDYQHNTGENEILTEKDCMHLSKYTASENTFYTLAIHLGVPDIDIKIIKENYKSSVEEQAYQSLLKWKQLKGEQAQIRKVRNALLSIGRRDIAELVCKSSL